MSACRHLRLRYTAATIYVPCEVESSPLCFGTAGTTVVGQCRCEACGEVVPLGHSDEEPVAVEVRAAARAAIWADESYRPGYDRFDLCPARPDGDSLCDGCHELYLARCIVEHKEES